MKKFFSIVFFGVLFFFSCTETELQINNEQLISRENQLIIEDYIIPFDMEMKSFSNMNVSLNNVGEIHNSLLDFQRNYLKSNPIIPENLSAVQYFNNMYSAFFLRFGIEVDYNLIPMNSNIVFEPFGNFNEFYGSISNQSIEYKNLMVFLKNTTINFSNDIINDSIFLSNLEEARSLANTISDEGERLNILSSIEIARYSLEYWKNNFEPYDTEVLNFMKNNYGKFNLDSRLLNEQINSRAKKYDYKEMAEADIAGALYAGKWGLVAAGGPAGAIACGLAGGAGASAVNLIWQHFWLK